MTTSERESPVQATSDWMAVFRAEEHRRADRYLVDPYAQVLAGVGDKAEMERLRSPLAPTPMVLIRGRLTDGVLNTAVGDGVRQAVCLGAGSDTRAWRLGLPGDFHYIEVDLKGQLEGKGELLKDFPVTCRRTAEEADLRGEWALKGHDPAKPTVWIAEGLFYYLSRPEAERLVEAITKRSARGSRMTLDVPHDDFLTDPERQAFLQGMRDRGSPFVGSFAQPARWLAGHGWSAEACLHGDLNRVGWAPPIPDRLVEPPQPIWFVRAQR